MLVLGAGGHAKEVLDIIENQYDQIMFIDTTLKEPKVLFKKYIVQNNFEAVLHQKSFVLGVGTPAARKKFSDWAVQYDLKWNPIRSKTSAIGKYNLELHETVDIMNGVSISNDCLIGKGTLLNRNCNIHHDVVIGEYCEVAPAAQILGKVKIGNCVFIGAGAIVLPGVQIADFATIGAGAVITENVGQAALVVGNPGRVVTKTD